MSEAREKRYRQIRKANRQQLNYIRRDLHIVQELQLVSERSLCAKQQQYLKVIEQLYCQQKTMYDNKVHKIEHRIVRIHQPWIRPIVRGKATANVEFGAKISISMADGYSMIENVNWEAFNEAGDLQGICERYKDRTGHYPERILTKKRKIWRINNEKTTNNWTHTSS